MTELTILISQFQKLDSSQDLRLARSEAYEIQAPLFDSIDTNKNDFLDLTEWFSYKQRPDFATVTQKIFWNGIYDHNLPLFKKCGAADPYNTVGILISMGVYLGNDFTTDKDKASQILSFTGINKQALNDLPVVIEGMAKAGIKDPEKIRTLMEKTTAAAGPYPGKAFEALPSLLAAGIKDPEKIRILIEKIVAATDEPLWTTFDAIPYAIEAIVKGGIKDPEKIRTLIEKIVAAGGARSSAAALMLLPAILSSSKADYNNPNNLEKLIDGMVFLIKFSGESIYTLDQIFPSLKLDITEIDYNKLPNAIASHLREYITDDYDSLDQNILREISVWINTIHDADMAKNKKDVLRQKIADNLDFRSAYLLIALGGYDLYTSSFMKIWDVQAQRTTDLLAEIKKADPNGKHTTDFILTLCNFGRVDLLNKFPLFFLNEAIKMLSEGKNIVNHTALLIKLFDALLPVCSPDDKKRLTTFLINAYQDKQKIKVYHGSIAYLIKLYAPKLRNGDLEKIASTLPAVLSPKVPRDQWVKDGAITAKLYFYPDEQWYKITGDYYKKTGWVKDSAYMKQHNHRDNDTAVYSKQVLDKHGRKINLRVILTQSKDDDREESINNDEFDIIVHRGHSFHIRETFINDISVKATGKLFFGGSCGSFRDMTDGNFLKKYGSNFFMADKNTGQGNINNDVLTRLMEEVAKGCTEWNCMAGNGGVETGLELPNSPSFLIGEYLQRLESAQK